MTAPTGDGRAAAHHRSTGMAWPVPPSLAAGLVAVAAVVVTDDDGPVLCPFRLCTGGYCPGCGLSRAGGRLARGDLAASWHQHPFALLAALQLVVVAAWCLAGRRRPGSLPLVPLLVGNGAVLVGLWILRLMLGDIPAPFAG
ncbi:MAG: DUF2752 domain-containing protein [Acidimicrobiales bacterium]